ncbi:MAG: Arc family DNA-binding protein [Bacteroidota bacterium]
MSEKKKFLLRVENEMYEALEKWAADDLRSVNAQIEFLLTKALRDAGRLEIRKKPQSGKKE